MKELEEPLLCIVVPTRNRRDLLLETLQSLLDDRAYAVTITVVDGSSTDGTAEAILALQAYEPRLQYMRSTEGKGFDFDLDLGVRESRAKFTWMLSDDDVVHRGAVRRVYEILRENETLDVLVVNADIWDVGYNKLIQSRFSMLPDQSGEDVNGLFENCVDILSFMGSCIVRTDMWRSSETNRYYGSLFVHIGVILGTARKLHWRWLAQPIIKIRYGNASWTGISQSVWLSRWPELISTLDGVSQELRDKRIRRGALALFRQLVLLKALGQYRPGELSSVPAYKSGVVARCKATVALVPRGVCYWLSWLWAHAAGKRAILYDLMQARGRGEMSRDEAVPERPRA